MVKIFDTHAHYDDEDFDEDRDELIGSLKCNGVLRVVNIGASMQTSRNTVALTNKYDFFYGAVGVHPSEVDELEDIDGMTELEGMTKANERIVAIGEIGLDYHYEDTDKKLQKKWFMEQLELARRLKLPVVIHSREAAKDTIDIMRELKAEEIGGVIHCYSYEVEMAKLYEKMGYYFGIGGVLTFQNSRKLKEVVEYLPI
ncbi:MAG: TatD family hydrolase, partial [Wujia sp.]